MPTHKSEDYKLSVVEYYLTEDKSQEEVCKIFKCSARSLMRWVDKYNENGEIKRQQDLYSSTGLPPGMKSFSHAHESQYDPEAYSKTEQFELIQY